MDPRVPFRSFQKQLATRRPVPLQASTAGYRRTANRRFPRERPATAPPFPTSVWPHRAPSIPQPTGFDLPYPTPTQTPATCARATCPCHATSHMPLGIIFLIPQFLQSFVCTCAHTKYSKHFKNDLPYFLELLEVNFKFHHPTSPDIDWDPHKVSGGGGVMAPPCRPGSPPPCRRGDLTPTSLLSLLSGRPKPGC